MRIVVVALFALVLIFTILQYTEACKCCGCGCGNCCGCGCGCGGCGCCGCGGWGGWGGYGGGWGGYGGWGHGGGYNHHTNTIIRDSAPAVVHSAPSCAPSVVGIPVLGSLGTKGCGCRGACSCYD